MARRANRSDDLAPGSERARRSRDHEVTKGTSGNITKPDPDEDWCKVARMMWDAGMESGATEFYESTDYAALYLLCDQIDYLYRTNKAGEAKPRSPEMFKAIMTGLGNLLVTEGDRRKLRVELTKPDPDEGAPLAAVASLFDDEDSEDDD
jgi:hypothetical protein